jgi:hypothetical protein
MGIMCSAVTEKGLVTFDIGVGRDGDPVYRVSVWNGKQWIYSRYRRFEPAHKTYVMARKMI